MSISTREICSELEYLPPIQRKIYDQVLKLQQAQTSDP